MTPLTDRSTGEQWPRINETAKRELKRIASTLRMHVMPNNEMTPRVHAWRRGSHCAYEVAALAIDDLIARCAVEDAP